MRLHPAAWLDLLHAEVARRLPDRNPAALDAVHVVCFPVNEVIEFDGRDSADLAVWWCRICGQESTARTAPEAASAAAEHLRTSHHGEPHGAPDDHIGRPLPPATDPATG